MACGAQEINLPKLLTAAEFIAALAALPAADWCAILGGLMAMAALFVLAQRADDRRAFTTFYPTYFEQCAGQASRRWWVRMLGALGLFVLTKHHVVSILFTLPLERRGIHGELSGGGWGVTGEHTRCASHESCCGRVVGGQRRSTTPHELLRGEPFSYV